MTKIGLALSGGGFRATLFHLGILRFLKDVNLLHQVTDIASVSGGSILAAHLTLNWHRYTGSDDDFDEAVSEIVRFVQFDVRNHVVRRLPFQYPARVAAKLTHFSPRQFTPNAILEKCYERYLYGDRCLYELPEQPMLHMLATSVSNGGLTVFNRNGVYIQQRCDLGGIRFEFVAGQMASIPRVVGASSAFPGFFPPVEFTAADLGVRDGEFPTEYFTDGGVYDNLGIRAFSWLEDAGKTFDEIYVSDAGKPFQILSDNSLGFVGQSIRASDILWDRVWQLERENFGKQTGFIFLPITDTVEMDQDPTLHPVVQAEVQTIRTDLDRFSDEEINALAQHGYEVARKAYRQTHPGEAEKVPSGEGWAPIPNKRAPGPRLTGSGNGSAAAAPPTAVARRLRNSALRRVWSTLFDWRDWTSYVYIAIAIFVFGYLPFKAYQFYKQSQTQAQVIAAISSGNPDIHEILGLLDRNPLADWQPDPVLDVDTESDVKPEAVEFLDHSRIIDLRRWKPLEKRIEDQGGVYIKDRISVVIPEDAKFDPDQGTKVVFRYPSLFKDVEFHQPDQRFVAEIRKLSKPVMDYGVERWSYEVEYDFSDLPRGEPVTLTLEMFVRLPAPVTRAPFATRFKTDLVSVWMLFPEDRPYQNYELVSYPIDKSKPPTVMNSRYRINHPYGSLIGWSVVNPEIGYIYECRWTNE
ncbi:patatin-like phospholipase family protein [Blastopirellula sp. JC732]|uniref:Patatin-like phospholipase family protein n=1 Tax=Blastopirellula sediminis TaxID=2894196 RepID=A0A9X1SIV4_9BACT|nr:patatin-like phospholipase family protein [Blastopirellula sediminis]MCC9604693.1 patatin-like phospholipase family protein [Blastopirellula sediminis]MCC9632008.1 patatin-like phospholipase family protein [Blastopirellula sediminis]